MRQLTTAIQSIGGRRRLVRFDNSRKRQTTAAAATAAPNERANEMIDTFENDEGANEELRVESSHTRTTLLTS